MTVTHVRARTPLVRFARLGPAAQAQLALSWLLLGLTRAAIAVLPFARIRRQLGEGHATAPPLPPATPRDAARSRRISGSIARAATRTPWRSDCYPQAITAHLQLKMARVPHTVVFGMRRVDGALSAHAWVDAADHVVTGGDPADYTVVGSFTWLPRSSRRP